MQRLYFLLYFSIEKKVIISYSYVTGIQKQDFHQIEVKNNHNSTLCVRDICAKRFIFMHLLRPKSHIQKQFKLHTHETIALHFLLLISVTYMYIVF